MGMSDLRLDGCGGLGGLLRRHHVSPADGEQGDIAADLLHLGDEVCVPGEVEALPFDSEDEAQPAGLPGVESFVDVVGRHRFDLHALHGEALAGAHGLGAFDFGGRCRAADDHGVRLAEPVDILRRAMIEVLVADQDEIGLGRPGGDLPGVQVDHRRPVDAEGVVAQPVDSIQQARARFHWRPPPTRVGKRMGWIPRWEL
jgi:hypothetical protein